MASATDTTALEAKVAERISETGTKELAVRESGGIVFKDANQVMEFAKMAAIGQIGVREHIRGRPGVALAITVQALDWGLNPYALMNKSYAVNNQIAYESSALHAVILKRAPTKGRPKAEYRGEGADRQIYVRAELRDEPGEFVDYLSPKLKDISPKNSPLWKNDPDQQLHYYGLRAFARRHFPDVLMGAYDVEEAQSMTIEGTATEVKPTPKGVSDKLDALAGTAKKPEPEPEATEDAVWVDAEPAHDPETGEVLPPADDEELAEPAREQTETVIDRTSDAYKRGVRDFGNKVKKCLSSEIKNDPEKLANWQAGYDDARDAAE